MATTTNTPQPSAPLASTPVVLASAAPVDANPAHPFFGHGGSYRFDPATGQTVLLERAGETTAPAAPDPSLATPSSTPAQE